MSIDSSIIICVLFNELFLQWIKLEVDVLQKKLPKNHQKCGYTHGFIPENIILLLVVIYTLELLILLSSDISMYHDTFDMMHRYSIVSNVSYHLCAQIEKSKQPSQLTGYLMKAYNNRI